MKKALVVFLALAMIAGVFADEPVAEASVAKFSGEASVTWGVDLDTEKTGFSNHEKAELEIVFVKGGDKATSGDGVWAEIKIKTEGLQYKKANENNASKNAWWGGDKGFAEIDVAKIHLGPVYVGVRSGDTKTGKLNLPRALQFEEVVLLDDVGTNKEKGIVVGYSAGDIFSIDVDFRSQPIAAVTAVGEQVKHKYDSGTGDWTHETIPAVAGVTGTKYTNNYGVAAEITSKPISGLTAKAGFTYDIEAARTAKTLVDDLYAMSASVAYKMNIGDKGMYVEPAVGYVNKLNEVVLDASKPNEKTLTKGDVGVGVLFGFSDETGKDDPGLPLFNKANSKKSNAGASVAALFKFDSNRKYYSDSNGVALATPKDAPIAIPFYFDVWTGTKLVPNLNAAAFVRTEDITAFVGQEGASSLTLNTGVGVKYDVKLNDLTITPKAGMMLDIEDASGKVANTVVKYSKQKASIEAGVDVAGLINNTTVSVLYKVGPFEKETNTFGTDTTTTSVETRGTLDFTVKIAL